jgi:AAA domain
MIGAENIERLAQHGRAKKMNGAGHDDEGGRGDFVVHNVGKFDFNKLPPRPWVLANTFCRRVLSQLLATGGVGKSTLRLLQCLSVATGRKLSGEHVFFRGRVLLVCFEDDHEEMMRRVYAAMLHYKITPADLDGWLFVVHPRRLRLAEMRDRAVVEGDLGEKIRAAIEEHHPDLVHFDPFIKLHGVEENDNSAIDFVCGLLIDLAEQHNCAVDFIHHTNKGPAAAGDANRSRGASSAKDAGRLVYTLTGMTEDEATLLGIPDEDRRLLVRLDSAKVNIAPPSRRATWFRLVGVPLGNGDDLYPNGDEVQTIEPWSPPDLWEGISPAVANAIVKEIADGIVAEDGTPTGSRYSAAGSAKNRAAWRVVTKHRPTLNEKQAREIINTWVKNEVLREEEYDDPAQRKKLSGLILGPRRPGAAHDH